LKTRRDERRLDADDLPLLRRRLAACSPAPRDGGRAADIKGDPDHPANFGRVCSKGSALAETLSLDNRLTPAAARSRS
jgi:anaerobic selenocysteine-containing dehydrogenase